MIEPAGYIIHGVARGMEDVEKLAFAVPGHPPKRPHTPLYAIPPGYVLVKAEPTEAMIEAGCQAYWDAKGGNKTAMGDLADVIYRAMIEGEQ